MNLRLALTWTTVVPLRGPSSVTRDDARRAIAAVPLVGVVLGAVATGILVLADAASLPPVLGGILAVAALALLTRGMHVDGLADTADGLGCYGPPERAREVMKSGGAGPFGVAALAAVGGVQAVAFGDLVARGHALSVIAAVTVARCAVVLACRASIPAATTTGFGALVAATQGRIAVSAWCVVAIAVGAAVAAPWWQGAIAVALALAAATLLVRHCVRRFGGLVGDVLGATIEVTTAVVAVGLLVG
ncbi:adenosylcobinamide-GDP ribazoletransferase [Rhodococcoides corynebacterioides]|uniref:adenosylcobinamide-GDP ribazoletransferase n=1 Tax=Rhodococcoides corynebacterioides TaxID=53972 RepID=UPI0008328DC9|nr:adenosylcobinamide-GDP ribazoletransferase [Rhodococcus corynebacterioides]MBY6351739.1 adenosylcobinamide-GDP ribazoletransferase [Rhodococcus corynebacterioides]MBY6364130.1 adenosylcobinamide-GDP ribazoletransferase [Rhodococcus corynebacterioides]